MVQMRVLYWYGKPFCNTGATEESNPAAKAIWERYLRDNPSAYVESDKIGNDKVLESSKNVYIAIEYIIKQFRGYPCELDMSKMHITRSSYGIIFHKESPYIKLFRRTIEKHRSAGLYNQIFAQHRRKHNTDSEEKCPERDSQVEFREVGFLTILSAFLILCCGMLVAFICLTVEKGLDIMYSPPKKLHS